MTAGHTGQLSQLTAVMNSGGNMIRTFTTAVIYMEDPEGDCLGLIVMSVSFICNCVIVTQVFMYQEQALQNKDK